MAWPISTASLCPKRLWIPLLWLVLTFDENKYTIYIYMYCTRLQHVNKRCLFTSSLPKRRAPDASLHEPVDVEGEHDEGHMARVLWREPSLQFLFSSSHFEIELELLITAIESVHLWVKVTTGPNLKNFPSGVSELFRSQDQKRVL